MSDNEPLTRRQFSRRVAGATVGLLAAGAAEAQTPPAAPPKPPAEDPRIAALEKERGVPLTEAQRKALPAQLRDMDGSVAALRKVRLADGGRDPGTVFHPLPPKPRRPPRS